MEADRDLEDRSSSDLAPENNHNTNYPQFGGPLSLSPAPRPVLPPPLVAVAVAVVAVAALLLSTE